MRTTITVSDDVAAEMERLRRVEGLGPSEALNRLARRGMAARDAPPRPYVHRTADLGLMVDVSNIGDVLDLLDDLDARPDAGGQHRDR
ncbi:MAG: CopG family transcriptional regulator [Austwickia sp.]|nr:CopG family transcriptional regulator [Austwickia sp.]MCO5307686.1 CopG family transcriptional regulator [Austwickia sp.]